MVRVTEKSSSSAVTFAVNKAKSKLEELQLKGANLKKLENLPTIQQETQKLFS